MASSGRGFVVGPDDQPDRYRLIRQIGGGGEAEQFEQTAYLCLQTTAGRYGYLESDRVVHLSEPEIHYYYVIWKKPGDP